MKPKFNSRLLLAAITLAFTAPAAFAASGTWIGTGPTGNFIWGGPANWASSTIADGSGFTASFTYELTVNESITVNTARTIGNITFTDTTSSNDLTLLKHASDFVLTLAGTTPTINVTQAGRTLTINPIVAGTAGLTKSGVGNLTLTNAANTYTGNTLVTAGTLNISGSGTLSGIPASSKLALQPTLSGGSAIVNYSSSGTSDKFFAVVGANVAGTASVLNQSAGIIQIKPNFTTDTQSVVGATGAYGAYNISGGIFRDTTGTTGGSRFTVGNIGTASATNGTITGVRVGIVNVSGTGTIDHTNAEWWLNYSLGQINVTGTGKIDHTGSSQPFALIMNTTVVGGSYGVLNLAGTGAQVLTGAQPMRFGNSATAGNGDGLSAFVNLAAGTLSTGTIGTTVLPAAPTATNFIHYNYAGGTLKATAALATGWTPTSGASATVINTIYGPIDNTGTANDFTGGLTVDTNGFAVTVPNAQPLLAASGVGVSQGNLSVSGGSGYIGAPSVTFSRPAAATGVAASGYALLSGGAVTGIVITNPGVYASGETPTVILLGGFATGAGTAATVTSSALTTANTSGGLTKTGAGTLTLSGAGNTYSGATLVSNGALQLDGSAATTPTTASVTVSAGGSLGFTAGAASTLDLTGKPITLGGGALAFDIGATGVNDLITVSNLTLTANSAISLNSLTPVTSGATYTLLTSTNPIVTGGFSMTPPSIGKLTFSPTINTNSITITPTLNEGIWNQTGGGNWSVGNPGGPSAPNWDNYKPTVAGDAALFGSAIAAPSTINVDTAHSVGYLRFNSSNAYTIGSGASSNLTIDNGANAASAVVTSGSHVIAENVTLASNLFAAPATGTTLTVSGNLSGTGKTLQLVDAGTLVLSGSANSYTGATTVSAGTLSLTGALTGGAAITVSGTGVLSESSTGVISGTSSLAHSSSGTSTLSGANTYSGATTVTAGTLTLDATGSITTAASITVLNVSGATAVANIAGSYTSTGGGGVALNSGGIINTSGTVAFSGSGSQALLLGTAAGSGTWNVTGGSVSSNYPSNGWGIGSTGGTGTLNVSAGLVDTAATNVFNVGHGAGGTGILNITGTGLVTVNAGTGAFRIGANATSTGTVNLDGGTLALGRNVITVAGSVSTFNFNGGVLKAGLSSATYMTGLTNANVRNGGAKIDTNTFNVSIGQSLIHSIIGGDNATDGGLTKSGIGTLTLAGANTYTGPTSISGGTLQLDSSAAVGPFTTSGTSVGSSGTLGFTTGAASTLNLAASPLNLGGTLAIDIGSTGISDSVTVNNFSLTGNSFVAVNPIGAFTSGGSYTVLTSASPIVTGGFSLSGTTVGRLSVTPTVNTNTVTITPTLDESAWNFNGSENWDTGANWTSYKPTLAGDAALFGSVITGPATVTVNAAQTVGYLRFNNANSYTIGTNGSSNLTLDNLTAPALIAVTSGSHTIAENVALTSNLLVGPLTGTTLTVSGNLSGTGKTLQLVEAGTLVLSGTGNSYTGTTTVSAGTMSLTGSLTGGGAINVSGTGVLSESATGIISGATALNHSSSGTSTLAGANTSTGAINVTNGQLKISNWSASTMGAVLVSTGGILEFSGSATYGIATRMSVGATSATTGTVNQTGGTVSFTAGDCLLIGTGVGIGSTGIYNLSGGTLTSFSSGTRGVMLGANDGNSATFNLSGTGNLSLASSILMIGRSDTAQAGSTALFTQTGAASTATVNVLTIGGTGLGTATGTMSLSAGIFVANTFTKLALAANDVAVINISGTADVTLPAFPTTRGAGATTTINFDGGTLKPKAASATYMGGLTNAFIKAGGAKFDTTGFDITVTQDLLTDGISTGGGLNKAGSNTLTLTGTNTYTGGTAITGGILSVTNASALGNGAVTFNGGTRLLVATGLNLTNAITIGANTGSTGAGLIQAGATAGTATVSGAININNGAATGGHFAAPTAGTVLHVSGPITSTVDVTHRVGTVRFSGGGTGYTSMFASGNTVVGADNGIATTATVTVGASTACTFDLNGFNQSLVGITKGANAATIGNSSTTTDSVLTTTGTSSYDGTIVDVISPGTRKVGLAVSSGQLTLTGDSSFTGNIAVNGGKLSASAGPVANNSLSGFGASSNTRTITVASGATLEFATGNVFGGHNTLNVPNITVNGGTITNKELVIVDPLLIKVNNALRNVTLNSGTITATEGNQNSNIDVVNRPGEGYGAWCLNGTVTSTGTSTINTGLVTGKGGRILLSSNTADTVFEVTSGTLTVSAPLQTGESTPNYGLTKNGAGTLSLTAANIYTTNTTVNAGTLALADDAQLKFVTGATSGTNNSVTGAGTVTIDGDFIIDTTLTDATALTTGSWTLVDASTLIETFGSSFTIPGWSEASNVWTKIVGSKKYTFAESSGILTLAPAGGYSGWQSANSTAQAINLDHDNDGVSNGVEYFLGGSSNTTGFTPVPGVVNTAGTLSITWTKAASYTGTYGTDFWVETSATLANPWTNQIADPAPGFTVTFPSANEVKYTFPAGTTNFARLKVTGP